MLGLCMIAKGSGKEFDDFFSYHDGFFDDIVIIVDENDTESLNAAKSYSKKVYSFRWCNDFSKARNFSIEKSVADFIIWLDLDERINKEDFSKVRAYISKAMAVSMIQRTYTNFLQHPRFVKSEDNSFKGYYDRRICKMFARKVGVGFSFAVHESVVPSLRKLGIEVVDSDSVIMHYPEYKSTDVLIEKHKSYLALLHGGCACPKQSLREHEERMISYFESKNI